MERFPATGQLNVTMKEVDNATEYYESFNLTDATSFYATLEPKIEFADPTFIFGPKRDNLYIVIPITIIYVLIFVSGLFGNVCTCFVIIRNKSLHTATNYYLFSLAVSDLLLLVSGMPQEIYSIWSKWPYVFGETFCVLRGLAAETSANASVLTITSFTIERFLAICYPFLSHTMSKLSRAIKHILIVWIISFSLALPQALQFGLREHRAIVMCLQTRIIIEHSFEISTFLFFFAPMVLITVLYALIGLKLSKARMKRNLSLGRKQVTHYSSKTPGSSRKRHSQSTRRVVKMLVAVVTAFFVCWAPFHAQRLVAIYGTNDNHQALSPSLLVVYGIVTYASGVLYYMSTAINPILYHIMSNKFREAFKATLAQCCGVRAPAAARHCPYSPLAVRRNAAVSSTDNSGNSVRDETSFSSGCMNRRNPSPKNKTTTYVHHNIVKGLENVKPYQHEEDQHSKPYCYYHNRLPKQACTCDLDITNEQPTTFWNDNFLRKTNFWATFNCVSTEQTPSIQIEDEKISPKKNTVARYDSLQGTISNSSLEEVERKDLEDELTSYMTDLKKRQMSSTFVI